MMADVRTGRVLTSWQTLLEAGTVAGLTDGMLLERFAARRDGAAEVAFTALVARHGPMVRQVCRRLLDDPHDAEDAFQATFLVLARKAGAIRHPNRLSGWLYGTAHRVSSKLKVDSARRRRHEARAALAEEGWIDDPGRREEVKAVLEEVARLPETYRAAVVLCELEGLTQDEAARSLGHSDRTLRRQLTRAHDLLRARLIRRGVVPGAAVIATTLAPEPAAAAVSTVTADTIARAATQFVTAGSSTGLVPASSAFILAEGVIKAMFWIKWKGVVVGAGAFLALGIGAGVGAGFSSPRAAARGDDVNLVQAKPDIKTTDTQLSPAEQYRALLKRYNDAVKAYQEAAKGLTAQDEIAKIYERSGLSPANHAPAFVALAERYPRDPVAIDALLWVVELTFGAGDLGDDPYGKAVARATTILASDHAGDSRLGPLCLQMIAYDSPNRERFLRAIAERSPTRTVKGQATLALAEYLRVKATQVELLQHPDAPENLQKMKDLLTSIFGPDALASTNPPLTDAAASLKKQRDYLAKSAPNYLRDLLAADPTAIRRESEKYYSQAIAEFGDVPHFRIDRRPTRETLADAARRGRRPATTISYSALENSFRAAEKAANKAADAVGPNAAGMKVYMEKAPKWAEFGPKMWKLAEDDPRSPAAFDALLWIVGPHALFDAWAERAETTSKAVDVLIQDHLDTIAANLAARNVAAAFNHGYPVPGPHIDRLYRALYERGRDRETRGHMGLALGRHLKAEADLAESFAARGTDRALRPEIMVFPPAYVERLARANRVAMKREAETILERVKADYGDVKHLNGEVVSSETIAAIADRELADIRSLALGQIAPEITGVEVDGKPMTLSEFRGKVVLLDFGSHEHCGGCRLVYPRLRQIIDEFRGRPFVVLGVNNNDSRDVLKQLKTRGEITWRTWWDGDQPDGPGPITTRWNIRGYPTFIVLDHRGTIRFKDLYPQDVRGFGDAVETLVKQAESDGSRQ